MYNQPHENQDFRDKTPAPLLTCSRHRQQLPYEGRRRLGALPAVALHGGELHRQELIEHLRVEQLGADPEPLGGGEGLRGGGLQPARQPFLFLGRLADIKGFLSSFNLRGKNSDIQMEASGFEY